MERSIEPMTIVEQLRDVRRGAFIKLSKDERLMVGDLCHRAADEIERLTKIIDDASRGYIPR